MQFGHIGLSHFPYSYAYILLYILLSIIVIILYLGPDGRVLSIESEGSVFRVSPLPPEKVVWTEMPGHAWSKGPQ